MKQHRIFLYSMLMGGIVGALLWTHSPFTSTNTFHAHLTGWYPTDPITLTSTLASLDQTAKQNYDASFDPTQIRALIVPHAGYRYSGDIAAATYRLINPSPSTLKRIIVLAPSHRGSFSGVALPSFNTYTTPLGPITIDQHAAQQLATQPLFTYNNLPYKTEHSFEVQVPFIQTYAPGTLVLPLLIGNITNQDRTSITNALKPLIDAHTLVIASSDFTHYGTSFAYTPFTDHEQERIKLLDSGALQAIQKLDANAFIAYVEKTGATICGKNSIATLLDLLALGTLGPISPHLIAYKTSADVTGESSESVSYVGMIFSTEQQSSVRGEVLATQASNHLPHIHDPFTQYEKRALLTLARTTLETLFDDTFPSELHQPIVTPTNSAHQGVFVTLYKKGALRGCIGRITTNEPIYKTVVTMTRAAALEDSRFTPVTHDELPELTISISILTNPRPIANYQNIIIGQHGIILTHGTQSALFLPKVATEFKWDLATTLSELSEKAGLSRNAWQNPNTHYQVFESIDFAE